ncbi:MAG TPA: hypothetical protein VK601_04260 [Kofleriaceae bacterium]|nr:hypothetical protein [Kofleriaceae bacterium]
MPRSLIAFVITAGLATGVAIALLSGLAGCGGSDVCKDDHCVCALGGACSHDCSAGGNACEVQCGAGEPCDVGCAPGEHCHVECSNASSCDVDCGSSPECHVTCPASGCTVHACAGAACTVTCGTILGAGLPTRTGTTATCP